jgi:hypothetical protein
MTCTDDRDCQEKGRIMNAVRNKQLKRMIANSCLVAVDLRKYNFHIARNEFGQT